MLRYNVDIAFFFCIKKARCMLARDMIEKMYAAWRFITMPCNNIANNDCKVTLFYYNDWGKMQMYYAMTNFLFSRHWHWVHSENQYEINLWARLLIIGSKPAMVIRSTMACIQYNDSWYKIINRKMAKLAIMTQTWLSLREILNILTTIAANVNIYVCGDEITIQYQAAFTSYLT